MRKLLIVDDEKIIRETIASLIDWNALDIELIGAAKDGVEAYNMILDEYPDIVLTDIKMPGFSGLELIQRIHEISQETQFIILSGFGEFEYAKKAMQYGVKHYLLKPCNEEQIVDSLKQIQQDFAASAKGNPDVMSDSVKGYHSNLMTGIINDSLSLSSHTSGDYEQIYDSYKKYIDFYNTAYDIFYIYYVVPELYPSIMERIQLLITEHCQEQIVDFIYVHNTLLFFVKSPNHNLSNLCACLDELLQEISPVTPEFKRESYSNLFHTMTALLSHIRKYERIYFSESGHTVSLFNYQNIIKTVQELTEQLYSPQSEDASNARSSLFRTFAAISDAEFLKQLAASSVIYCVSKNHSFDMVKAAEFLVRLEREQDCDCICALLEQQLDALYEEFHSDKSTGDISRNIQELVHVHIQNPELSLKWIAENHLFMNVDYLSKRFLKETGLKFSKYLTDVRISHAKELLAGETADSIQDVADMVGCGNNPQYFSQIFKKETHMTPSRYAKMIRGEV